MGQALQTENQTGASALRVPALGLVLAASLLALPAWAAEPQPAKDARPTADAKSSSAATEPPIAPVPHSAATAPAGQPAIAPAVAPAGATAAATAGAPLASELDERVQQAKHDALDLHRDLLVLEEELLYPVGTQFSVFVSLDVGLLFELESVRLKVDDKEVSAYLYTPQELAALRRGGIQRLYMGNLRNGGHDLVAVFTGRGPHQRDYRRATSLHFDKGSDPRAFELQIRDDGGRLQPEFTVRTWQ
jgi:hypothetical protein